MSSELPNVEKGELIAIAMDQNWNFWNECAFQFQQNDYQRIFNHNDWLFKSIKDLQNGDICFISGNFFFPTQYLIDEIQAAAKRGARFIITIIRFYVGGYDINGKCYSLGCDSKGTSLECPGNGKCCNQWGKDSCIEPSDDPSCQNILYPWGCGVTMWLPTSILWSKDTSVRDKITIVDIPNLVGVDHQNSPYQHLKMMNFFYKKANKASIYQGSMNLDTTPQGHGQNEVGWGFVTQYDSDFSQFFLHRNYDLLNIYKRYYGNKCSGIDQAINWTYPYLIGSLPKTPIKIPNFKWAGPKMCQAKGQVNTYDCEVLDQNKPWYCQYVGSKEEDWVAGHDKNILVDFGVSPPPQGNTLEDFARKGWPQGYKSIADLLSWMIGKETTTYMKGVVLSQGLDQGPNDMPQNIWDSMMKLLKRKGSIFMLQSEPGINDSFSPISFATQASSNPGFHMRCFTPAPSWRQSAHSKTHEKLFFTNDTVMYTSGHPQIEHFTGAIVNEAILFSNVPNFKSKVESFFNTQWICGSSAYTNLKGNDPWEINGWSKVCCDQDYEKYVTSHPKFIVCGDGSKRVPDSVCCSSVQTKVIPKSKAFEYLNILPSPCDDVKCKSDQHCDKNTGKCVNNPNGSGGDNKDDNHLSIILGVLALVAIITVIIVLIVRNRYR